MKNTISKLLALILIITIASCDDNNDSTPSPQVTRLEAIVANPDQTVAPFTEVTLDGSQSTGPDGFSYEWIYTGSENVNLSSTTDPIVTFTPEKNTNYGFTLRLTHNGKFSEASANVSAIEDVELNAALFPSDSDVLNLYSNVIYVLKEDFIIPTDKTVSVASNDYVYIKVENESGIIVNGNWDNQGTILLTTENSEGWKGMVIDGGSVASASNSSIQLVGAGTKELEGLEKAGVTVLNGGSLTGSIRIERRDNHPEAGIGINYMISAEASNGTPTISLHGYSVAAKAPVGLLHLLANVNPSEYDYIEVTTSGAGVTEASINGEFQFTNKDYYITDGFSAGSRVTISNANLYFKEDVGLISAASLTISSSTLKGINDVNWKGIAGTSTISMSNSTIEGAGSSVHNTGSFTSTEKAAVYASVSAGSTSAYSITNSTITGSQGYGVYVPNGISGNISGTTFSDNADYDVSASINTHWPGIARTNNTWSTTMPIRIRGGNSNGATITELGEDISFYVDDHINAVGELKLQPGVNLKFADDKGISASARLTAIGTEEKPIVFDGVGGTPGSWKGIELLNFYQMEYCTITNGGSSAFQGQNPSNVIFGGGSSSLTAPHSGFRFNHNTVSNSAGWGWQVKHLKFDPLQGNTTNTFENNATVDSDGDGIPDDAEVPGCENDPGC